MIVLKIKKDSKLNFLRIFFTPSTEHLNSACVYEWALLPNEHTKVWKVLYLFLLSPALFTPLIHSPNIQVSCNPNGK